MCEENGLVLFYNQMSCLIKKMFLPPSLGCLILLTGCAYYPTQDGELQPQPLGDVVKCSDMRNQHLPSCYCHKFALKKNPEREPLCRGTQNSWLKDHMSDSDRRSLAWLKELRRVTADLESYQKDKFEYWNDNSLSYLNGDPVVDDCDALDSLLDIIFAMGGFRLDELAKVLVDSNPYDFYEADHYVAAVWVKNKWVVLDHYFYEPQPILYLELGGITARDGFLSRETKIVSYRRLDQAEWRKGRPPNMNMIALKQSPSGSEGGLL